jgi:flagellar FliL protein
VPAAAAVSAEAPSRKKAPGGRSKLKWIVITCLVLGAGGGGWWFWQAHAAPKPTPKVATHPSKAPAQYFALEPAFVVNLADTDAVRYLQADVQLMTRDPATRAAIEQHAPALRNRLLLLFGQQSALQIAQRRGKERLQQQALAEVRAVLKDETAPDKVEAVYFTSLVTQ